MKRASHFTRRTAFGAVAAVGLAGLATGFAATAANAAAFGVTLSATSGPSGGLNTITAVPTTAATASKFASGFAVEFQFKATSTTACTATYAAAVPVTATAGIVAVTAPKLLSTTKIATTVPATVALQGAATSASWLYCVYAGNTVAASGPPVVVGSALVANAAYTIAAKPTVTSVAPAGGPALGGGTITVNGSNLTGASVTVGGLPLTGVVVAANANSLTGTVPAHSAGATTVAVTTTGGVANLSNGYTYSAGIIISPNTTPTNTAATDIDVSGVGFASMNFATTTGAHADDTNAHVYLVPGVYDPSDNSGAKTLGEAGECLNVLPIGDTELICTVDTADSDGAGAGSTTVADGLYTMTVVSDGGVDVQSGGLGFDTDGHGVMGADPNYSATIVSSGSTFTVAAY